MKLAIGRHSGCTGHTTARLITTLAMMDGSETGMM